MSKLFAIYEVDLEVQRSIVPLNLSRMMDYIMLYLDHGQGIYFPGIILSARGAGEYDPASGVYRLQAIEKLYVVDGQHRLAAFRRLMETLQSAMRAPKTAGSTTGWKKSARSLANCTPSRCRR